MAEKKKQPTATAPHERANARSRPLTRPRRIQNFLVVWLDASIDEVKNQDSKNTILKLHEIVKDVNAFIDMNECVDFISSIKEEKAFIISSGAFGQTTVPVVHDMSQVSTIYIFCGNKALHEQWAKGWPKVDGVFTDIKPICEALKKATQVCDQNSIAISFVAPNTGAGSESLDQLDQSFMYTQILKEILLTIDFDQSHIQDFIKSSRELFVDDVKELRNVDKLEREYQQHTPIWWYTYQSFLFSILNRALRLMEVDMIISMGFFVRDLHQDIVALHTKQFGGQTSSDSFTVYRGQGLAQTAFDQMMTMKGGLLSFNNFLSTTTDRQVSLTFARQMMNTSDLVGIVFVLKIDPSIPSTPFAKVREVSYFQDEDEILFSMHSIFRIKGMKKLDGNNRLWEVDLALTSDNDPQLRALTDCIREDTSSIYKGWDRLGKLMIQLGQFNQAEKLYEILLKQTASEREEAHLYNQLGEIKRNQGEYVEALVLYEKSLKINEKILPPTHPDLATAYNNIGTVYQSMKEYSKALSYYEKALKIKEKTLSPSDASLAASYNNIGVVYREMKEYRKALVYYEKALKILQETLPPNHPSLGACYNNIGLLCDDMGEYPKALSYYDKMLEIQERTLPPNHPSLVTSYNNIGLVYYKTKDYSKSLSFYERALSIGEHSLSTNHPIVQVIKKAIETVKKKM